MFGIGRGRLAITALVLCTAPALAQDAAPPPPNAQGDLAVTIYNNDLGLIQDKRELTLPRGRTRQEFADVSAAIRPETVTLTAANASVVEQNFDYDLLAPEKLMDKAVGQTVTVIRTNPATGAETRETARVLANNGGTIVQIGDRIEVLGSGQRVVFPSLPAGLRARPTLSITLDSDSAGSRPVTLNYLSRGLGWKADYVALFDSNAGKLDVQGWITLTNTSGTTFNRASTLLVAGAVGTEDNNNGYRPNYGNQPGVRPRGNRPGTETAGREQLGDFYVYPLAERTTIANAQTKQVSFLDVSAVPAAKGYFYRNPWLEKKDEAVSVDSVLKFSSSKSGGLGDALPAGTVRVYMRDARGSPQFIGESAIPHTPMGSALALKTGEAFDVKILPTVEKRERIEGSPVRWRTTMSYRLTNARGELVTVELAQAGLDWIWSDTRVLSESQKSERAGSDEVVWKVAVPANGATTVTATFDTRY
ncbi:DUF4139 domain-containing protein [Sphingomonas immobilis]|uniref:DUF4139 domain-containing protein n=1 Tax=Sphingomonas immobilis TaxID=3063997 RepID=A0ABT9A271_9SPHN|nr:DUF4139 domain-containing protein [Sphingomonas sp. CA1-15]MDO7843930.1 DUF4139 domain-containing protein [Sphingomonas sp. CA1-15]